MKWMRAFRTLNASGTQNAFETFNAFGTLNWYMYIQEMQGIHEKTVIIVIIQYAKFVYIYIYIEIYTKLSFFLYDMQCI